MRSLLEGIRNNGVKNQTAVARHPTRPVRVIVQSTDQRPCLTLILSIRKWPRAPHRNKVSPVHRFGPWRFARCFSAKRRIPQETGCYDSTGFVQVLAEVGHLERKKKFPIPCCSPKPQQGFLPFRPVVGHRVNALSVEIRPGNIPFRAVVRRPQNKKPPYLCPPAKAHRRFSLSGVPCRAAPAFEGHVLHPTAPALQHRPLHGFQRHANLAGPLVTLQTALCSNHLWITDARPGGTEVGQRRASARARSPRSLQNRSSHETQIPRSQFIEQDSQRP